MADEVKASGRRRSLLQATALVASGALVGTLIAGGGLATATAAPGGVAAAAAATEWGSPAGKVPMTDVDMGKTYTNPINLPGIEVSRQPRTMPATDEAIANVSQAMLDNLAKEQWVEADSRDMVIQSIAGFRTPLSENSFRTGADFSAINVDGTIYVYASGALNNDANSRTAWSTTDYLTWTKHDMNVGLGAPTVAQVGEKFYFAGNNTPLYVSDTPVGPWTELGAFRNVDGTELRVGDVQLFPDDDGRLYLVYNIGSPIMGVELDANDPRQALTEPVVMWSYDPTQEWQHFGDNKGNTATGFSEAGQLFKVGDTYYMSAASGGTESTTYATGIVSSKSPLEGFSLPKGQVNPIGYSPSNNYPSALYPNAGHGSFVVDDSGDVVFFYTSVIAYENKFERRLGIDKCEVSPQGAISCDLSNTPQLAPGQEIDGQRDVGLYNLSTNTSAYWASSYAPGRTPYYAADRAMSTWWQPEEGDETPTFINGLVHPYYISAAQIQWKEIGLDFTKNNAVQYTLEYKDIPTNSWKVLVDKSDNTTANAAEYVTFDRVLTHAVRVKITGTTENVTVGIGELGIFGENYTVAQEKGMFDPITPAIPVFADVPEGTQFFDEIQWLASRGVSTGWELPDGSREYRPVTPVARDAMAAFLYRLAESPAYTAPTTSPFTDVATDNQFYKEISWLAEQEISTGWDNGDGTFSFRPLEPIARDAMAAFLYRYADVDGYQAPTTAAFSDVGTTNQFYKEISWLAENGIATGWAEGNDGTSVYRPLSSVNRDAMAAFMFRLTNISSAG